MKLLRIPLLLIGLLLIGLTAAGSSLAEPNLVKGGELFKQCMACHQVGSGAQNTAGPQLNHLFGRRAASIADFNYSAAMQAKGQHEDLIWTEKSVYIFVAGPERYIPGTLMSFAGLRKEKEIRDLIAWLLQYSPAYQPGSEAEVDASAVTSAELPPAPDSAVQQEQTPTFTAAFLAEPEPITIGADLWTKQCRHCHGNLAYPGKAPKLKPDSYSADYVFDRITNGFKKMPAWKSVFTLDQRKALTAYVLSDRFSP